MRSLYDRAADRKYTSFAERLAFFEAVMASTMKLKYKAFCLVLLHTGCRITEALNLKRFHIDQGARALVFVTLKQRGDVICRPVPVPQELINLLLSLPNEGEYLLNFGRTTGWKKVKQCMSTARIEGIRATPKGLRHGYAIGCVSEDVKQPKIQDLLGHKRPETTSIYTTYTNDDVRRQIKGVWFMGD